MKKQLLAVAIAASLAVPQVGFAAEDDSGMQYTSASEGLFGSLRTRYISNEKGEKDSGGRIEADGSVFGYRGTLDLGHGLTGIYHYEQRILAQEGETLDMAGKVRYNFVGVRGAFGEANFGSFGSFVAGVPNVTDVTANGGGNFVPFYRTARGLQYMSPELNGFQAGGHIRMSGGSEKVGTETICRAPVTSPDSGDPAFVAVTANSDGLCPAYPLLPSGTIGTGFRYTQQTPDAPAVDQWAIAGKYKVRGFQVGATYIVDAEEWFSRTAGTGTDGAPAAGNTLTIDKREDAATWFVSGKYAQDNWAVAIMHGQKNTSDNPNTHATKWKEDETYTSVSGNVSVGKVGLAVLHDIRSDSDGANGVDKSVTALSATYNFTSRSRVWAAYIANDDDGKDNEADQITIGMRMDF